MQTRYVYYRSRSRTRIEDMLEHLFAVGEVSEGERPRVERRGSFWLLTLEG